MAGRVFRVCGSSCAMKIGCKIFNFTLAEASFRFIFVFHFKFFIVIGSDALTTQSHCATVAARQSTVEW